ncbi:MAG TPA: sigma-70 family RNA polymerase sigma factor [Bacteroidia bacterium]|nr:sigma-70 family RNA polymerase sigma factor [Bacteroidia bacterium]
MSDEEIIQALQQGNHSAALKQLYKYYPAVRQLILQNSGNKHDAEDIYQEALIILCRKVKEKNFQLTSGIKTFLFSISRLQWMNELRKKKKELISENVPEEKESEVEKLTSYLHEEEKFKKAESALMKLGEKCRQLLQLFYAQKKSFKEIADALDLSNEKVAKNQKYRCMEKARENYLEL